VRHDPSSRRPVFTRSATPGCSESARTTAPDPIDLPGLLKKKAQQWDASIPVPDAVQAPYACEDDSVGTAMYF
jgi:hypothetical protein